MSSLAAFFSSYLVNALWQIPLLAGTGWVICRFSKRLGPVVLHRIWVAVLFTCILLPFGHAWKGMLRLSTAASEAGSASVELASDQMVLVHRRGVLRMPAGVIDALSGLYLALFLFFLSRLVISMRSTLRVAKQAWPCPLEPEFLRSWEDLQRLFHLSGACILTSAHVTGPVTLSLHGPVLLLPEDFFKNTLLDDFRVAAAHECAHMKRHDFIKNLFYEGLSLLIAFHPVTWLIRAELEQTREMTCDAMAVQAMGDSRGYVQALLRLAGNVALRQPAMTSHAIGIFDANILEKRVMMLRIKKQATSVTLRAGLVLAGGICLFLAAAGGATAAVVLASSTPTKTVDNQQDETTYKIGNDVKAPKVVYAPLPEFPKSAPKDGPIAGSCLVGLVVDTTGTPREVYVLRSFSKDFDQKAIEAVEKYRFAPGERFGKPVPVSLNIEVHFQRF